MSKSRIFLRIYKTQSNFGEGGHRIFRRKMQSIAPFKALAVLRVSLLSQVSRESRESSSRKRGLIMLSDTSQDLYKTPCRMLEVERR